MRIENTRVGTLEVDPASILTLPAGLIGLPHRKRFVLLEFEDEIPLGWLQSVDDPSFSLPVAEPGLFSPNYRIEVPAAEVRELGLANEDDAVILIVTTIAQGGSQVTGNLRAPLVVNAVSRIGCQVILNDEKWDYRTPMDPIAFSTAAGLQESLAALAAPAPADT